MGQHTDATIEANEANARDGYVVAAPWGYFLLDADRPGDDPDPILAWRIGKDADCNAVLPVTAFGTHGSQTYVLRPDGRVVYHAIGYGSRPEEYGTLDEWRAAQGAHEAHSLGFSAPWMKESA